jgi:hypothetical protein
LSDAPVGEYFHSHYAYSSPQFDLHGHGFLGFEVIDECQPDVPTETVTSYALTDSNGFYPGAFQPTNVLRMTPVVTHALGETPRTSGIFTTRL